MSLSSLRRGVEHVDLAESGYRAAMADRIGLGRLAFAIVGRTVDFVGGLSAQAIAGVPKIGGAGLVSDVAQHCAHFSFFDLVKGLAAELEIVSLLIDGPTAVAINQNSVVHAG